jgi:hypothetical protein
LLQKHGGCGKRQLSEKISLTIFDWEESWKLADAMHALASASIMPLSAVKKTDSRSRVHIIVKVAEKSVTGTTLSDG